MVELLKKDEV